MSRITVEEGKEAAALQEIAYHYEDDNLGQKLPVYKGRADAFWMGNDGGTRLMVLMNRFKIGDTVKQACYSAKISYDQFRYFALVHPWMYHVIKIYKATLSQRLKGIVLAAALGGIDMPCPVCNGRGFHGKQRTDESICITCKGNGMVKTPPNAKMALGALRVPTLQDKEDEPELMDMPEAPQLPHDAPPGSAAVSEHVQAFSDGEGNVVVSKKIAARLKTRYGNNDNPQG